jgi:alpha-tubulin suppressor-like RCC1 family protein
MHTSKTWERYILTPKLLPWFNDAIAVCAKGNQSFAQRSDGKIYPWGQNMLGTLGVEKNGNVEQPKSPIFELKDVADLGNGALHTLAIRNDDEVFSWGWSFEGSLGGGKSTIHRWAYRLPILLSITEK